MDTERSRFRWLEWSPLNEYSFKIQDAGSITMVSFSDEKTEFVRYPLRRPDPLLLLVHWAMRREGRALPGAFRPPAAIAPLFDVDAPTGQLVLGDLDSEIGLDID
jgi:hypothetical protein